jgi:predicted oxidoreductase
MSWGSWGKQFSTEELIQQLDLTLEAGITTFDHADIYGDYTTEAQFGKAFKKSKIERERIQLISKCGIQYVGATRSNKVKHYNYSKDYILWSVEQSLKNLETDYLDLLLLHRPSPLMHPDEINEAILILKNQGKIIDFGVSNFTASQIDLISHKTAITANQIEFSLTQNTAMFNGDLDKMMLKKIQPMCWSPLGTVFKEETTQTKRIQKVIETLSEQYQITEDAILLAWVLKHPAKIYPVIGTTTPKRILNAQSALEVNLELEDWFELLVASQGHKVP